MVFCVGSSSQRWPKKWSFPSKCKFIDISMTYGFMGKSIFHWLPRARSYSRLVSVTLNTGFPHGPGDHVTRLEMPAPRWIGDGRWGPLYTCQSVRSLHNTSGTTHVTLICGRQANRPNHEPVDTSAPCLVSTCHTNA